eukprot:23032-Eustigmatos_ZCMA.PRE.1
MDHLPPGDNAAYGHCLTVHFFGGGEMSPQRHYSTKGRHHPPYHDICPFGAVYIHMALALGVGVLVPVVRPDGMLHLL